MLGTLDIEFDHSDFQRKLRHYFMDSAPIDVDLVIRANSVLARVPSTSREVEYFLQPEKSVKDNIHDFVELCESSIYPKLEKETFIKRTLSIEERKQFLIQGLTLEDIEHKSLVKSTKELFIARISAPSMTMIIKSLDGEIYLARFQQPLIRLMKELNCMTPSERYTYILSHSEVKDISNEVR